MLSRIRPRLYWLGWILICLSADAGADVFGAGSAVEIAKLTQIINQMTTLIERTDDYINLQKRLAETQERAFFRKSTVYASEIRKLIAASDRLDHTANSFLQDPLKLKEMHRDIAAIRRLAEDAADGNTREVLLGIADTLDMMAQTEWLTGTADATRIEMATKEDSSEEGQLLAGIYNTLADIHKQDVNLEARYRMRALSNRQRMMGLYSVFDE